MKWFLKYAGWQAYAVFAAVLLALGAVWFAQVEGLKADVATAKAATATAEKNLTDRIAAEATAIADAVTIDRLRAAHTPACSPHQSLARHPHSF